MKTYTGPFVSCLLNGMTCVVWSHKSVVDGMAFYVRGSLSRMEAFLLVTPIPRHGDLCECFLTHFPLERALSAKDLDGSVRTTVKANVFHRRFGPIATSRTCLCTAASPKAPPAAVVVRHEGIGSQALFQEDAAGWAAGSRGRHVSEDQ